MITDEKPFGLLVQSLAPPGIAVEVSHTPRGRDDLPAATVLGGCATPSATLLGTALGLVRRDNSQARTIVVVPFTRELVSVLTEFDCRKVLWCDEVHSKLPAVLGELLRSDTRHAIRYRLHASIAGSKVLRSAVDAAFSSESVPGSVSRLARRAFCTPATLRSHWHRAALPESPLALVHWALLSHLTERLHRGETLESAQCRLPVHRSTLERLVRRRLGCSAMTVDQSSLLTAFDQWLRCS